jgi:hypothetical protein
MPRLRTGVGLLAVVCLVTSAYGQWIGRPEPEWEKRFQVWVADPHLKVYPNSFGRDLNNRDIEVQACRNEWIIVQLGVRSPLPVNSLTVTPGDLVSESGGKIHATQVRRSA